MDSSMWHGVPNALATGASIGIVFGVIATLIGTFKKKSKKPGQATHFSITNEVPGEGSREAVGKIPLPLANAPHEAFNGAEPSSGARGSLSDGNNEWAYTIVAHELETGKHDTGVWLKAFVEAGGDATKQKVAYVKARVSHLISERYSQRHDQLLAEEGERALAAQTDARRSFDQLFTQQALMPAFMPRLWRAKVKQLVELAIRGKVDLNTRDRLGNTLIHIAAHCGAEEAVGRLLQAGADPNVSDHSGFGPIHNAEIAGELSIYRLLEQSGARVRP